MNFKFRVLNSFQNENTEKHTADEGQGKKKKKNRQDQTNEEEIGSLPEKEFRVMIVKMIQNLRNKMEAQINRIDVWVENIQKVFNDNTVIGIKNTLE